jgi:FkbM family methyltransferase
MNTATVQMRRPINKVLGAVFVKEHYLSLFRMAGTYPDLSDAVIRYVLSAGKYPARVKARTPAGVVNPTLYSWVDMLTLNEVFCRKDYETTDAKIVVDFGSNIGLSALYFLTHNPGSICYLWEPLKPNVERLIDNLRGFENRYFLSAHAVGLSSGIVKFGVEPTGRYGGIGLQREETIEVYCEDVKLAIDGVLEKHPYIDVLKIDVEGLELDIVHRLAPHQLSRIGKIFAETQKFDGELAGFYTRQKGTVTQFFSSRISARD